MKSYALVFWVVYLLACISNFQLYKSSLNGASLVFCFSLLFAGIFLRKLLWGTDFLLSDSSSFSSKKNHRYFLYFGKVFPSNMSHREEMKKLLKVSDRKQMLFLGITLALGVLLFFYVIQKSPQINFNSHLLFCLGNFALIVSLAYLNHLRFLIFFGFSYSVILFFRNSETDFIAFLFSLFLYSLSLLIVDKVESKEGIRFSVLQNKFKHALTFSALLAFGLFFISEKQEKSIKENIDNVEVQKFSQKLAKWMVDNFHRELQDLPIQARKGGSFDFKKSPIPEEKLAKLEEAMQLDEGQVEQLKLKNLEVGGNSGASGASPSLTGAAGASSKLGRDSQVRMGLKDAELKVLVEDSSPSRELERELAGGKLSPEDYLNQMASRGNQIGDIDQLYSSYRKNAETLGKISEFEKHETREYSLAQTENFKKAKYAYLSLNEQEKTHFKEGLEKQKRELENHLMLQSVEDKKQDRLIADRLKMDIKSLGDKPGQPNTLKVDFENLQRKIDYAKQIDDEQLAGFLAKNSMSNKQLQQANQQSSLNSNQNIANTASNFNTVENPVSEQSRPIAEETKTDIENSNNRDQKAVNKKEKQEDYARLLEFIFKGLKMFLFVGLALFLFSMFLKFGKKDVADKKLKSRDIQKLKKKLAQMMREQKGTQLNFEEEVLKTYHEFLIMFEILDFAKPKDQVPSYFQFQVARHFPDLHNDFSQITDHFCDVYYGKQEFNDQQKNNFYNSKHNLQKKFLSLH
ncbi:MAG: hypothetical protein VX642_08925 [Bdellovibrionota bacterium]|nr:hypothetical protein [Bdellovibrionota bacterium]